jgi:hypothetical protein
MSTPASVAAYLAEVAAECDRSDGFVASCILFGSAVTGGFRSAGSDLDLIFVLADTAPTDYAVSLRRRIETLEAAHGLADASATGEGALQSFARRVTANVRSFFICSRSDFLSGDPARLLGISQAQALFVDRVVVPSIIGSARTVWGEELLDLVPLQPIRRVDVFKAWFSQWNQLLLCVALYPAVPAATKYAAAALKRSIHNCYFCCHLRTALLDDEVAYFRGHGISPALLDEFMALRRRPRSSFGFILRSLPALVRLHLWTARTRTFPRQPVRLPAQ